MTVKVKRPTGVQREQIVRLTEEYGGEWLVQHAQRLLRLISWIGEGQTYHEEAIWLAAWLHDWGTCPKWTAPGMTHAKRSRQVAEKYLTREHCPEDLLHLVLECIEYHHGGPEEQMPIEAVLLHDADALDGIGVIGVLKECAMLPTEVKGLYSTPTGVGIQTACERAKIRMENNPRILKLEKSRELAKERIVHMQILFRLLEGETDSYF